ncbi:hypothetical protein CYY_009093 [Polysphondylium violaceum]|uniref:glucose-6-phosphate 1-epimerase n=1 Tax=Polysphondylium violaceum TaxID=133409 RepID=A0A8J4PPG5_9MYCE|nr:hypothetical protein CYY_009093 [Polysphondylium violaceum]
MTIESLQKKWNRENWISIESGKNNLPKVVLTTPNSLCEVYLHGAHITSFKTNNKKVEHLFVSEKSIFQDLKAIRGGIPLIWPQFGPGSIQTHGFARNIDWEISRVFVNDKSQSVEIEFTLHSSEYSQKIWGVTNEFKTTYTVTLHADHLDLGFDVRNVGQIPIEFQLAFHTYYSISDIENVHVLGLKNRDYIDKLDNMKIVKEQRRELTVRSEVDSVYLNVVPEQNYQPLQLVDLGRKQTVTLTYDYQNIPDVVVWNPWIEKSKKMDDFQDDEYKQMICIEVGVINKPIKLTTNQLFQTKHSIIPSPMPAKEPSL